VNQKPLDQDGLRPIIYLTVIWAAALVAQLLEIINWNTSILAFGVAIGVVTISFLSFRRYRRRQR
jgi:membrane protein implicated in regulation of membrane protease activity